MHPIEEIYIAPFDLTNFLLSLPPDQQIDLSSNDDCLLSQYARKHLGFEWPMAGSADVEEWNTNRVITRRASTSVSYMNSVYSSQHFSGNHWIDPRVSDILAAIRTQYPEHFSSPFTPVS